MQVITVKQPDRKHLDVPSGYLYLEDAAQQVRLLSQMQIDRKQAQINSDYSVESATNELMVALLKQAAAEVKAFQDAANDNS